MSQNLAVDVSQNAGNAPCGGLVAGTDCVVRAERSAPGIVVIDGVLSVDDLDRLAPPTNAFTVQRLGGGRGRDGLPERREHAALDDDGIAALLWARVEVLLPPLRTWFREGNAPRVDPPVDGWSLDRCNNRIRYYRYRLGDRFAPHFDETFRPREGERTFLTVLVYLPTEHPCMGGETVIDGAVVPAVPGRIVVFDHRLIHEGRPIERGEKLVLRTDVIAAST